MKVYIVMGSYAGEPEEICTIWNSYDLAVKAVLRLKTFSEKHKMGCAFWISTREVLGNDSTHTN